MQFAIRRDVSLATYEQDLEGLGGVPTEIALPHRMDECQKHADQLPALAAFLKQAGILCPSVHAPQGRLSDDGFLSWAGETVRFAEAVGAGSVVFHPERVTALQRPAFQLRALKHLLALRRDTRVRVAVETFGSRKCVLTPEELGERELWMVLDTSHLFQQRTLDLIERYHATIAAVHLSEQRKDATGEVRPHLPVESFGIDVLTLLKEKKWCGTVTLEYLPEYHDRLLPDRAALEALFDNRKDA